MFSICIPNYNYEKYLGITLESIFSQRSSNFEVTLADNCSTDGSLGIIKQYAERFPAQAKYKVNTTNLGFAGNLDQAASLASQRYMLMLSSDDTMSPDALLVYTKLLELTGNDRRVIISAANDVIDSAGKIIRSPRAKDFRYALWREGDVDAKLSEQMGVTVYRVGAPEMLKRSLLHCSNPFNFLATAYHHTLYHEVGGYGGGRMINPDKWFHWKILSKAEEVFFIDQPLFQYRWHAQNQTAQQANSGFLKYLADEYRNTMEVTPEMLSAANVTAAQLADAFIAHDIVRHGIAEFAKGRWLKSFRTFVFGLSTYPSRMLANKYSFPYLLLLFTTPVGSFLASKLVNLKKA